MGGFTFEPEPTPADGADPGRHRDGVCQNAAADGTAIHHATSTPQ